MGRFNRDEKRSGGGFGRRPGGDRSFGGGPRFGGRDGGRPTMNQATCSACGKSCEVPFKPTGDRPVYCRDCFGQQSGRSERPNRFDGAREERPRFGDKHMHDAICAKCGNDCQVPFRPVEGKPIYCSNCFEKGVGGSNSGGRDSAAVAEQLKALNTKIDKLIALLTPRTLEAKNETTDAQDDVVVEAVVKEKKKRKSKKK